MNMHTPGPWTWDKPQNWPDHENSEVHLGGFYSGGHEITTFGNNTVYYPSAGEPPSEPDAKLIAAAPDLLAACQEFCRKVDAGEARSKRSYQQMAKAIEKATT